MDAISLAKRFSKTLRNISLMFQALNEDDHFWWLISFKNLDLSGPDAAKRLRAFARELAAFISQHY